MDDASNEQPSQRASEEFRSVVLPRGWRGYDREAVDLLVTRIVERFLILEDQVDHLKSELEGIHEEFASERESILDKSAEERDQFTRVVAEANRERDEIAEVIEEFKIERQERTAYIERLELEIMSLREIESSLKHSVVAAERIGNDLRALGEREATALLEEARAEARRLLTDATTERDLAIADVRRIRAMLYAAQASLDERVLFTGWNAEAKYALYEGDPTRESPPFT